MMTWGAWGYPPDPTRQQCAKHPTHSETNDIIAWKVVGYDRGKLYPPVQGRSGNAVNKPNNGKFCGPTYSLFEASEYTSMAKSASGTYPIGFVLTKQKATRPHRTKRQTKVHKSTWRHSLSRVMSGFHAYNSLHHLLKDDWVQDGFTSGAYLVAKVRIWGHMIECTKGYQSEFMEIVELYSATNNITRRTIAHNLGYPFGIKDLKMEPQWQNVRARRAGGK